MSKRVSFVGPEIHDSLDYVKMTYSLVWSTDPGESAEFNEIYKPLAERREVWIAGRATPMFLEGVQGLGWDARTNLREQILPRLPWGVE